MERTFTPQFLSKKILLIIFSLMVCLSTYAATRTASVSGNWNATATWGGQSVPVVGDDVIINNGRTVTVTAPAACTSITFPSGNATTTTINLNPGISLTVSLTITIPRSNAGFNQITVGAGILTAGSIAFTNGGGANRHQITISTGSVTVSGNVTQAFSTGSATISFSGAGTLNLGGTFYTSTTGTLTTVAGSTVNYNGAVAQTVSTFTYNNLTLSGSGIKTTTGITVNGILSMEGTATASAAPTYGGAATLQYNTATARTAGVEWITPFVASGGVIITNIGNITVGASKTMNAGTDLTVNGNITTSGGVILNLTTSQFLGNPISITNNGTIQTSNTSATPLPVGETWGGTGTVEYAALTGGQTVVSGSYYNFKVSNTSGTNTVSGGNLTVTGTFTTTAGGTLNFSTADLLGNPTIANSGIIRTASVSATPIPTGKVWGGTVEYYGGVTQRIISGTYGILNLTVAGVKTASGPIVATTLDNGGSANNAAILDMGTNTLTATTIENTNGTIKFSGATNGLAVATGTVEYSNVTGGQTIKAGTYNTVLLDNTSGSNIFGGNVTTTGTLTTTVGGVLDVSTYTFTGTLVNNGTIQFGGATNGFAIATGTVEYTNLTGGQTIDNGTYNNLTVKNTSGINTVAGDITVNGILITTSSGILDLGTNEIVGNPTTIVNNGTVRTSSTNATPLPLNETWGGTGTIEYAALANQTIVAGTYNNLITSGSGTKSLANNITINGDLTISTNTTLNVVPFIWPYYNITLGGDFINNGTFHGYDDFGFLGIYGGTVTFNNIIGDQIISGDTKTIFYDFVISNNGHSVILNNDITINDTLNFKTASYLDLNTKTLTMTNWANGHIAGLINTPDRYVLWHEGKFIIQGVGNGETILFPVGLSKASTDYARVDVTNHDAFHTTFQYTSIYNYLNDVGTGSGGDQLTTKAVNLTYNITSASTNADITVYWDVSKELPLFTRTLSQVQHYNGTKWELKGTGGNSVHMGTSTIYSQFAIGVTSFSPYTVGNQGDPLPIELTYFKASNSKNGVSLTWETASETNNDYFTIEHSFDGQTWSEISKIHGAGTSTVAHNYSYNDADEISTVVYYRLKQTDFNGEFSYSKIVSIIPYEKGIEYSVYQNPTSNKEINVLIKTDKAETVVVSLFTPSGLKIGSETISMDANQKVIYNVGSGYSLLPGPYYVTIFAENNYVSTINVIVQ
jgi:hypothetical protein